MSKPPPEIPAGFEMPEEVYLIVDRKTGLPIAALDEGCHLACFSQGEATEAAKDQNHMFTSFDCVPVRIFPRDARPVITRAQTLMSDEEIEAAKLARSEYEHEHTYHPPIVADAATGSEPDYLSDRDRVMVESAASFRVPPAGDSGLWRGSDVL